MVKFLMVMDPRRQKINLWIFVALTLLLVPVQPVASLHCYACSSLNDANCWDVSLLSPKSVQECEDLYYSCMTRVTTMENFTFIGRNCMTKNICENTVNVDKVIEDHCVTCAMDFCNTGVTGGATGGLRVTELGLIWSLIVSFTVIHGNRCL